MPTSNSCARHDGYGEERNTRGGQEEPLCAFNNIEALGGTGGRGSPIERGERQTLRVPRISTVRTSGNILCRCNLQIAACAKQLTPFPWRSHGCPRFRARSRYFSRHERFPFRRVWNVIKLHTHTRARARARTHTCAQASCRRR